MATIHIVRHGQALHNVDRGYPHRDPALTEVGSQQASKVCLPAQPDLVIVSPMTRTIHTALIIFDQYLSSSSTNVELQVWPELRETHDEAICNKGLSRAEIAAKFPQFDFSACHEEWDYPPHSSEGAVVRAETVRRRLKELSRSYKNIFLVTHRGFIAFLVKGERFDVCECRSYRFAAEGDVNDQRQGINCDTGEKQDFGPSLLWPIILPSHDDGDCDKENI
ncbi:histidine phosphatase superfamily (branch 1) domain-containing protein [Trichoderma breve]|uniref:Histidine phosphatase superfamily (Branch 1) domain-containing protein n=1 Tax=Trichoderma breve TaxID=2034170 RepID=A0A9W9E1W4_9HYPO|nr:histidine phosphatase superfamily (branch 1) domain-containing protein [Trichoderma breve]KAJ4854314.1 histidine phosphatase superfamily (branch 1) domain-containing protein [Trichoderma breve]